MLGNISRLYRHSQQCSDNTGLRNAEKYYDWSDFADLCSVCVNCCNTPGVTALNMAGEIQQKQMELAVVVFLSDSAEIAFLSAID